MVEKNVKAGEKKISENSFFFLFDLLGILVKRS